MDARDSRTFVADGLPTPPARVLEVGAGSGDLARSLRASGYTVVAIDPEPGGDAVLAVGLADLAEPPASFDAAVAVVSLHHVEPLEASCRRLADVVRPGGRLVVDEFDVERFDERAAAWLLEQRHAHGHGADRDPAHVVAELRAELHPVAAVVAALEPGFEVGPLSSASYLYRWDLDESLKPVEEGLIADGLLPAVGVRFVAVRRARGQPWNASSSGSNLAGRVGA